MSQSNGNGGDIPQPTASELKFMIMVLSNQQNKAVIDWNDLAPKLGYASGAVASTRWGQIGKRLGFRNAGGKNQSNVSTPASTPVKLKVSGNMSSAALAGLDESPMKRKVNGGGKVKKESTRGRKKKGVRKAAASPEDTEDEDEDGDWQNNEGLKNEDEDVA